MAHTRAVAWAGCGDGLSMNSEGSGGRGGRSGHRPRWLHTCVDGDRYPGGGGPGGGRGNVVLGLRGLRCPTTTRRETEGESGCTAGRSDLERTGTPSVSRWQVRHVQRRSAGRGEGGGCRLQPGEWQHGKGVRKGPAEKGHQAKQEPLESGQKGRQEKAAVLWI